MEKLFGLESTINEIEEDDSEIEETAYNDQYTKSLKTKDLNFAQKNKRKVRSPDNLHKVISVFPKNSRKGSIKPFADVRKDNISKPMKIKRMLEDGQKIYGAKTETEKQVSRNRLETSKEGDLTRKKTGQFKLMKKKKVAHSEVQSRESNQPTSATTTHTSSIPSLPPVVKDSWFKDKFGQKKLDGLKKKMLQKKISLYEDFKTTGDVDREYSKDKDEYFCQQNGES